jgi:hypothetical protein
MYTDECSDAMVMDAMAEALLCAASKYQIATLSAVCEVSKYKGKVLLLVEYYKHLQAYVMVHGIHSLDLYSKVTHITAQRSSTHNYDSLQRLNSRTHDWMNCHFYAIIDLIYRPLSLSFASLRPH